MRKLVLTAVLLASFALPIRAEDDPAVAWKRAVDEYVQSASFMIRNNIDWRFVRPSDGDALVSIRFNPNGTFITAKIEERSGNPTFDVALESAVRRSIPMLPTPPIPPGASAPFSIPIRFRILR